MRGSLRNRSLLGATVGAVLASLLSGLPTVQAVTTVDAKFAELDFDYAKHVDLVGDGKRLGDRVLFRDVLTSDGMTVDAIVTTSALVNSTIYRYEQGAQAGSDASYFQVDTRLTGKDGYASFTFEFVKGGTGQAASPTEIALENVQISGIDSNQFNDFTGIQGFTWAANTRLKAIPVPTTFPADVRFLGSSATGTNDPRDQVVVTFGTLSKVTVSFGNVNRHESNYFGVAFKSIGFEQDETTSFGAQYKVDYDANGGTGTTPPDQVGNLGEIVDVSSADTLRRPGYVFAGWNTAVDGSGTAFDPKDPLTIPRDGLTLYAQWKPTTGASPTPSASPSASASVTPSPSASPSASVTASVSPTPSASAAVTPTATATPTTPDEQRSTDPDTPLVIDVIGDEGLPPGSTIREVEPPSHGTVVVDGDTVVYTPDQGFRGTDDFRVNVVERDGSVRAVDVEVAVGKEQVPAPAITLPSSLSAGVNVILAKPVRTNAGQPVRVSVTCHSSLRMKPSGDVRACVVRSGAQDTTVTIANDVPVSVRVRLSAPATGDFRAFESERTYRVR